MWFVGCCHYEQEGYQWRFIEWQPSQMVGVVGMHITYQHMNKHYDYGNDMRPVVLIGCMAGTVVPINIDPFDEFFQHGSISIACLQDISVSLANLKWILTQDVCHPNGQRPVGLHRLLPLSCRITDQSQPDYRLEQLLTFHLLMTISQKLPEHQCQGSNCFHI